jgi:predicted dehydrogenase
MKSHVNRRRFLQGTAVGAGYFFTATALSAARAADSPNGKIRFAGIGVGGKGGGDITQATALGMCTAICDVDENSLNRKANEKDRDGSQYFLSAKRYFDYRKMLDEMGKDIDAVTVGTPDHSHAPASVMAMRMKKHVYTQKPLTHTVFEARRMREIAKEMGVATQMGNQGSAANGLRRAVELIQSGIIGPVKEAHVWTNRPIWPQGADAILQVPAAREAALAAMHGKSVGQLTYEKPPKNVHWDEFLGPAPERPYAKIYHPFSWRGWLDFGTGALGDMACHTANMAFRALKLGNPKTIVASNVQELNSETYPTQAKVTFQFPERDDMPACTFNWYEGQYRGRKMLPPEDLVRKAVEIDTNPRHRGRLVDSGSILVGEKGMLYSPDDYGSEFFLYPAKDYQEVNKTRPEKMPINNRGDGGMKAEWVEAMKGGPPAYSNFDFAAMLTETILLGNIAIRIPGEKLEWDGPNLKFTNSSKANQYLHYEYRNGWTL